MGKVACIYCNREREAPPDTEYIECSVCVMKRMEAKVKVSYPVDDVSTFLDDKGWTWKDLAQAAGASYHKVLQFKRGEITCPINLQEYLDSV